MPVVRWGRFLETCVDKQYDGTRCIWAPLDEELVDRMAENKESNAKNFIFEMQESLSQDQFTMMVVTLWSIWYARHKAVYEAVFQSLGQTHSYINQYSY